MKVKRSLHKMPADDERFFVCQRDDLPCLEGFEGGQQPYSAYECVDDQIRLRVRRYCEEPFIADDDLATP